MAKNKILIELLSKCLDNNKEKEAFPFAIGCELHQLEYEEQLEFKQEYIKALFKSKGFDLHIDEYFGSPLITKYRNKMEYSFGDEYIGGELNLGLHVPKRYFDIVSVHDSYLVDDDFNTIVYETEKFAREMKWQKFNKKTKDGILRNLVIRKSHYTKEVLIGISTSSVDFEVQKLVDLLLSLKLQGEIVGILHLKNDSIADVVKKSDADEILFGRDYYVENILGLTFHVSFFSFFQTNTLGAELLYNRAMNLLDEVIAQNKIKNSLAFDLFCGTGTITQLISSRVSNVIGIEIVEDSVKKAIENARLNKINNCNFIAGDVFKVMKELDEFPDFIILDPPRSGVMVKPLEKIISYGVKDIIYISCNPKTMAIDYEILYKSGYRIDKFEMIDLYPHTKHVECIALMKRV